TTAALLLNGDGDGASATSAACRSAPSSRGARGLPAAARDLQQLGRGCGGGCGQPSSPPPPSPVSRARAVWVACGAGGEAASSPFCCLFRCSVLPSLTCTCVCAPLLCSVCLVVMRGAGFPTAAGAL